MSTSSRLACACVALGLAVPATIASADEADPTGGGSAYTSASAHQAKKPRSQHLGDRIPVRRGMRGHDVKILQDFLGRLGLRARIDGTFGRQTWTVLRRFEKRAKLPVDGVLDARDLGKLRRYVEKGGFPAPPPPPELPPGSRAKVNKAGLAAAPSDAPQAVKNIIAAGNRIASKPYRYGGGHGGWKDSAYDCSGSVSFALHGARLLKRPMPSGNFTAWGRKGYGKWVTIFAHGGHMYMVVAGLRFDTSGLSSAGSRWQTAKRSPQGYAIRHPRGL